MEEKYRFHSENNWTRLLILNPFVNNPENKIISEFSMKDELENDENFCLNKLNLFESFFKFSKNKFQQNKYDPEIHHAIRTAINKKNDVRKKHTLITINNEENLEYESIFKILTKHIKVHLIISEI